MFKYTLERYGSATLHVTFNGSHVELAENPYSYVLCAVDTLSNSEFRDSTAAIVNAKYHSHLSELYGLLLNSFEDELSLLQDIAVYSISHVHKSIRFTEDDICDTFRDDLLAGLGMFGKETFATRHYFIDYMKKIEVSYIAVSTSKYVFCK